MEILSDSTLAALAGMGGGIVLGLAARLGRFCTLGAIEDYIYGNDDHRMRMWVLAIGVAIIGSFFLIASGMLDASETLYLSIAWNPMASIFGGLIFGYGMAIAGNCGFGALARAGGGDIRSAIIAIVMGISAYMAMSGPIAVLRVWLFPEVSHTEPTLPGIAHLISSMAGIPVVYPGIAIGISCVLLALSSRTFRCSTAAVFWAIAVGLSVVSGWAATQWISRNGFDPVPVVSHTFSAPLGDSLLYLMTSTGSYLNFGIGSVAGVVIGAIIGSFRNGHFRWEACEDPRELRRQLFGAFLMGTGAVIALGCSIGQGMSAFSVLAYSGPVTFFAIITGAAIGLRSLIVGPIGEILLELRANLLRIGRNR